MQICIIFYEPWTFQVCPATLKVSEVAGDSKTGHFIKGKAGINLNTLATLIQQNFFCQGLTDHKSSTNHFIALFNFTFIFNL